MPDVLMLAKNDWANTGWRFFKCLQHLGVDVMAFKGSLHNFWYPEQMLVHPALAGAQGDGFVYFAPELQSWAEEAKVVHFIASTFVDTGVDPRSKKIVFQHGGTIYRQNHQLINSAIDGFVSKNIIQCPDLLGLGAKDEQWIYYPVDTDRIAPVYERHSDQMIIGHFPSNSSVKGTDRIRAVIERMRGKPRLKNKFEYVGFEEQGKTVIWTDNLKRMAQCDVIVETCAPNQENKPYGEWGNTALEASALGKVCVTNSLNHAYYLEVFGDCGLVIANSEDALEEALERLILSSDSELLESRQAARKWVEEKHSIPATARRLWDLVYQELLES